MRPIIIYRRAALQLGCLLGAVALIAGGCGNDDAAESGSTPTELAETAGTPTLLATTSIWADVAANVACDGLAEVENIIPPGGDPHAFQPSLSDRGRMESAALIVANGLFLEEGLEDTIDAVEQAGTPVFRVADHVSTIEVGSTMGHEEHDEDDHEDDHDDGHDEHEDEGHDDHDDDHDDEGHDDHEDEGHDDHEDEGHDDHDDEGHDDHDDEGHDDHDDHGHMHTGADPHVWFDPIRVADALPALSQALATQAGFNAAALDECVAAYRSELIALDAEVEGILAPLHPEERLLVTNHDALGYFADRYGFQLIGTVIPGGTTLATASPAGLQELVELIEETGVAAIFSESTYNSDEAGALGREAGVQVISLDTGSLGPADSSSGTYIGFIRTNAQKIAKGLG